jgi:hypothetical protein
MSRTEAGGQVMRKLVAVVALGAVVLVACGGKSSSKGSAGGGSKGGGDFASIVARASAATYKITYNAGKDTEFTIAQKPPRFSYRSGDSATYVTADGSAVACSVVGVGATTTTVTPTCTAMPGGDAVKQGLTSAFGAVGALFVSDAGKGIPGLASISRTSTRSIAGREAICATLDSSNLGIFSGAIKGSYSACVDKATGVMLQSKLDDGNGHVSGVKATAFGTPTEADLTPPAPPITIPGVTTG